MVYFSQASMYQSAESGFGTLAEAKLAGQRGVADYGTEIQRAFTDFATFVPMK
jgi:hypothetical protein